MFANIFELENPPVHA